MKERRIKLLLALFFIVILIGAQRGNVSDDQLNLHDITTNNVNTSHHGFAPKGTGTGSKYLDDNGNYSTPIGGGGGGGSGTIPTTGWTVVNAALFNDYMAPQMVCVHVKDNASLNWRLITRSSANTYTLIATISIGWQTNSNSSTYGLYVGDGTKLIGIEVLSQSASANQLRVQRMNSVTSASTTQAGPTSNLVASLSTFKIVQDSSHRTFYYWDNGAFTQFYQETNNSFLTEDRVGVGGISVTNSGGAWVQVMLWQWSLV